MIVTATARLRGRGPLFLSLNHVGVNPMHVVSSPIGEQYGIRQCTQWIEEGTGVLYARTATANNTTHSCLKSCVQAAFQFHVVSLNVSRPWAVQGASPSSCRNPFKKKNNTIQFLNLCHICTLPRSGGTLLRILTSFFTSRRPIPSGFHLHFLIPRDFLSDSRFKKTAPKQRMKGADLQSPPPHLPKVSEKSTWMNNMEIKNSVASTQE